MSDFDIPEFLRVTPEDVERRRQAWIDNPPQALPTYGGRVLTETEKLYRASIEHDKALRRERDRPRFEAMRAKAAAAKAELNTVKLAAVAATRLNKRKFTFRSG